MSRAESGGAPLTPARARIARESETKTPAVASDLVKYRRRAGAGRCPAGSKKMISVMPAYATALSFGGITSTRR